LKINQTRFRVFFTVTVCLIFLLSCKERVETFFSQENEKSVKGKERLACPVIRSSVGLPISTRFSPPYGFKRNEVEKGSFAFYLRNFPLLAGNVKVRLYDGSFKEDQSVHAGVLDIDVGDRDLQQCADAIMRLRAEHLMEQKKYDEIAFNFTNGWRFEYSKWRAGNDLVVQGNNTEWKSGARPKESYEDFRDYLDEVFMYAGTLSLSKELTPKNLSDIEIGDVFIKGGSPGHAVVVVDLAVNEQTGDKAFILAQSYMPAQQIHILKNLENLSISPWYLISEIDGTMNTPEWTFELNSLMHF